MERLPILDALILDENVDGIELISFVENPAIERDFIAMSKEIKLSLNEEKRLVTGPVLIPELLIPREDHYLKFTEESIKQIALDFQKHNTNLTNINHKGDIITGVVHFEHWIIEDPNNDKANALGFTDLPKGTLMSTYYVEDDRLWNLIKEGKIKGFSIEGYLSKIETKMNNKKAKNNNIVYKNMLNILKSIKSLLSDIKLEGYTLTDGKEIIIDEAQNVTYTENSEAVADGEYTLEDGRVINVFEGKLVDIKNPETEVTEEEVVAETEEVKQEEVTESTETVEEVKADEHVEVPALNIVYTASEPMMGIVLGEDGIAKSIDANSQIADTMPAGEYVLADGQLLSINETGAYSFISAAELMSALSDIKTELESVKKNYSSLKKEYNEFKKGFGGAETKMSKVVEVETVPTVKAKTELENKLEKLSGFISRKK